MCYIHGPFEFYNNIVSGCDKGVWDYTTLYGAYPSLIGHNAFYDTTDEYDMDQTFTPDNLNNTVDLRGNDLYLSEEPLMDPANNDFRPKAGSELIGAGLHLGEGQFFDGPAAPLASCDIGPWQRSPAGLILPRR